jgi:hypothetical protein
MRYIVAMAVLLGAGACANQNVAQDAADRCAAVGISARDPDFNSCMQAYVLESKQNAILNAYRQSDDPGLLARRRRCGDGC